MAEHIGIKLDNHSGAYTKINNILDSLKNNGLIEVETFWDGKSERMRLVKFSYHHKSSVCPEKAS